MALIFFPTESHLLYLFSFVFSNFLLPILCTDISWAFVEIAFTIINIITGSHFSLFFLFFSFQRPSDRERETDRRNSLHMPV